MSVLLEKRANGVAVVTINRPQALNALDVPAKERLGEIWQEIADDAQVRVAILTGAGDKAFCAGSDIKEIARTGRMVSTETLMRAIPGVGIPLDKPVIAALHGFCVGMGMTLALHCDLRLAARNTVLGYPEVKHGMISGVSAMRLPQVIPQRQGARDDAAGAQHDGGRGGAHRSASMPWSTTCRRRRRRGPTPSRPIRRSAVQATKRLALFPQRLSEAEQAEIEAMRDLVESKDDFKQGASAFTKRA